MADVMDITIDSNSGDTAATLPAVDRLRAVVKFNQSVPHHLLPPFGPRGVYFRFYIHHIDIQIVFS